MKLLTLNCHSWLEENQLDKMRILAETIKEKSYDVIALQEVNQSLSEDVLYDGIRKDNFALLLIQALQKMGVLDYQMHWDFSHIGYDRFEEGLALLTKHPVQSKTSFFVSNSNDTNYWKTRKIVKATIRYNNQWIDCYSCHLGWWKDEEEPVDHQIDQLNAHIDNSRLSFLLGDFNNHADIEGEGYSYLLQKGWYDTYQLAEEKDQGSTIKGKIDGWEKNADGLRIDLILANRPLATKSSSVIFNGNNKPIISDHYGVEIKCTI
ncbi:maltose 6'-phosphate phosphatase [Bacillus ectoiniformans]|uniref:endonuclease/exonuclease/phosphatase family protein n=1 Tax=Bacillus ectoiniformans TaxID=1494429 RepID=UPI0019565761|nr:endonuclease/exonuclease/phosphatase family protein [Bacillus ectoiniformans]MBM7649585.1 maltose 6'-phosphate phosphatase [Bacillus ectoiniformans]